MAQYIARYKINGKNYVDIVEVKDIWFKNFKEVFEEVRPNLEAKHGGAIEHMSLELC